MTVELREFADRKQQAEALADDIARIVIRTTKPLFADAYRKNRATGSVILIDEGTNNTVAAGMVI